MSNMTENRSNQLQFNIGNLGCSSCAAKMEQQIRLLPGVRRASLDFATAHLHLELEPDVAAAELTGKIQTIVQSLEQDACLLAGADRPYSGGDDRALPGSAARKGARLPAWAGHLPWRRLSRFAFGLLPLSAALLLDQAGWPSLLLYLAAYLILGYDVLWAAVRRIGRRQLFDEHFLMSLATLGALAIGEYPEAVAVMLFYQIGDIFQNLAVNHSRRSIQSLLAIQPDQAVLLAGQEQQIVAPSVVRPGDRLLIRPGDRVPVDSRILSGQSSLDTSALTGESQPRPVESGDEILAGSVNGSGLLTVEVLRPVSESAVSRILNLVESAAARKAPTEQFITRFAAVYTPVMVGLALALALLPPLVLRQPLGTWVYHALILLVISCPCALVLSVPLGYFAGLGAASGQGILVKGGQYLDLLAAVRIMAWDKTGTLTRGDFAISRIETAEAGRETQVLELTALAESYSSHPLARSVTQAWQDRKQAPLDQNRITAYHDLAGRGVSAIIDGQAVILGNSR